MKKLFICYLFSTVLFAQSIPEPVYNTGIYDFLENLSLKGLIKLNENIKPFSRVYIARKLTETDESKITPLEREYLTFYKKEYYYEILRIMENEVNSSPGTLDLIKSGQSGRWRLFKYNDDYFYAFLDPVLGIDWRYNGDNFLRHRWNGAKAGGYIDNNWGFYVDFRDNEEFGLGRDSLKNFTRQTGINFIKETKSSFEWSEVKGGITYSWGSGSLGLEKEFLGWGSGKGGQLILSQKAPSFPFIKLQVNPAPWLNFIYIHGFLHSRLIDSSSVRRTLVSHRDSYSDIPKYIASHMVSFSLTDNLNISLGESVVYSDEIEPLYLIPVMFFRLADHYLSRRYNDSGDNAQLFADAFYKNNFLCTKFYGTLFIDELSVTSLLQGVKLNAVAYTIGASVANPIFKNSNLTLEYSRLNPFVYMNSNDAQLFTSHGYQLGHWIGSNADQFYASYNQKIMRGLELKLSAEHIRKGKKEDPAEQYKLPYPEFLYGERRDVSAVEVNVSFEFIHDLFIKAYYRKFEENNAGLSIYYGL